MGDKEKTRPVPRLPEGDGRPEEGSAVEAGTGGPVGLGRVLQIRLSVSIRIAEVAMSAGEVLEFSPGMVMQLGARASTPLGLYVNNHKVAEGMAVAKGEKFALQLTKVASAEEMVRRMA